MFTAPVLVFKTGIFISSGEKTMEKVTLSITFPADEEEALEFVAADGLEEAQNDQRR